MAERREMKLLLIGPEAKMRRLMSFGLTTDGGGAVPISRARDLTGFAAFPEFQAAVVDWEMRDENPAAVLALLREAAPDLPVLALAGTEGAAAEARAAGAAAAVLKPVNVDHCRAVLGRIARQAETLPIQPEGEGEPIQFVTRSPVMEDVLSVAWRVAPTAASVLILGENGTGKSLLARALHARSPRRDKPFINVNCPCLQPQLLESELFGHVRGSFTGAVADALGKVAAAEGGTLFLDEVGELPPTIQAKLLRLLQERCYERVGESQTRRADIRVLAATNRDLRQFVAAGSFREDLYYRLNVITLEMPPLRGRPEDIIPTAEYFLDQISRSSGLPRRQLSPGARTALLGHSWPGNLRELRNLIERAAILADHDVLQTLDFPELSGRPESVIPQVGEFVTLEALVDAHIRQVTARAESYEQAARILGIDKSTLYRWRKRLDGFTPASPEPACV